METMESLLLCLCAVASSAILKLLTFKTCVWLINSRLNHDILKSSQQIIQKCVYHQRDCWGLPPFPSEYCISAQNLSTTYYRVLVMQTQQLGPNRSKQLAKPNGMSMKKYQSGPLVGFFNISKYWAASLTFQFTAVELHWVRTTQTAARGCCCSVIFLCSCFKDQQSTSKAKHALNSALVSQKMEQAIDLVGGLRCPSALLQRHWLSQR